MRYIEDLKFRLWSTQRKLWLAMGMTIVDFQQDASVSLELPILTSEGGVIVQQFTGLQDIDGNDIYEGDILKSLTINDIVEYKNGAFYADLPLHKVNGIAKIAGNIFEGEHEYNDS